jgi:hypothetical protein
MKPSRLLAYVCIMVGTALLALGFGLWGAWPFMIGVILVGVIWLILASRFSWFSTFSLILLTTASAIALILGIPEPWSLFGTLAILNAWDLSRFSDRLHGFRLIHGEVVFSRHLQILIILNGVALGVIALSVTTKLQLNFLAAFVIASLSIYFLTKAFLGMKIFPSNDRVKRPKE